MTIYRTLKLLQNKLRSYTLGRLLLETFRDRRQPTIHFVAATRMDETTFWADSPLGKSLKPLLANRAISHTIEVSNTQGLPVLYNRALLHSSSDVVVFLHDDVWLDDPLLIEKITQSLRRFDVVGLAGNTRIVPNQPAWLFSHILYSKFVRDTDHVSGAIIHGTPSNAERHEFGPHPARCELLDGVLLAANRKTLIHAQVGFDELFLFDFYDMDFCRSARQANLSLGTWPIDVIHQSSGVFGNDRWLESYKTYLGKWNH